MDRRRPREDLSQAEDGADGPQGLHIEIAGDGEHELGRRIDHDLEALASVRHRDELVEWCRHSRHIAKAGARGKSGGRCTATVSNHPERRAEWLAACADDETGPIPTPTAWRFAGAADGSDAEMAVAQAVLENEEWLVFVPVRRVALTRYQ
jgi:hypothetical protein